jgi:hypothetical protein
VVRTPTPVAANRAVCACVTNTCGDLCWRTRASTRDAPRPKPVRGAGTRHDSKRLIPKTLFYQDDIHAM